jgi:hypothetical protein
VRTPGWGAEFTPGEAPRIVKVPANLIAEITGSLNNPQGIDWPELPQFEGFTAGHLAFDESGGAMAEGQLLRDLGFSLADGGDDLEDSTLDAAQAAVEEQTRVATVDQLLAIPNGTASYAGMNDLSDGGSYDFGIRLDFSDGEVNADFWNINSPALALSDRSSSGSVDFTTGRDGLAVFELQGSPILGSGPCLSGCDVNIDALFFNAASPPATGAHRVEIFDPETGIRVFGEAWDVPGGEQQRDLVQ